jgi:hypothetical protein
MPDATGGERKTLPIPDRPYDGPVYEDAKDPSYNLLVLQGRDGATVTKRAWP